MHSLPARLSIAAATLAVTISFASVASAHSTGASFTATSSPYVVDIGYDPTSFTAGDAVRFDFVLSTESAKKATAYDQVWVRITKDRVTTLATGLFRQPFGPTTLLYTFADDGTYSLDASFRDKDGNEIAHATFPFSVAAGSTRGGVSQNVVFALAGVLVGALLGILFSNTRKLRRS